MRIRTTGIYLIRGLAFGVLLLALGIASHSQAQPATDTPTVTPTWFFCPTQVTGTQGSGNTQFNEPNGAAVYGTYLYVSDYVNSRVEQYDTNLNWIQNIGVGQVNSPGQVAVDSNGYLYVTGQGNNEVFVYNPASPATPVLTFGSFGSGDGTFSNPIGLAVDPSGDVYVSDWNYLVQKFHVQLSGTPSATFLLQWGGTGSGNGKFNGPAAIAVDSSNNIYVADTNNYRIQKFDSGGNYITQFGTNGTGLGQFQGSWGVQIGPCGNVYATDRMANFIQVFSPTGAALSQYGTSGSGAGQFDGIMGIAFDSSNNLFTTEYINNRLQKFSPCALTCGPTSTPTNTSTMMPTATPTFTGVNTATSTPTLTVTTTATPSPTSTLTSTPTQAIPYETSSCGSGSPSVQFLDHFPGASSLSNYTYFPIFSATPTTAGALNFSVAGGQLNESEPISGTTLNSYALVNTGQFPNSLSDYTVEADFNLDARQGNYGLFGLSFLEQPNDSGYVFQWNGNAENNPPNWQIQKDPGPSGSGFTYVPPSGFGAGISSPAYTPGNWVHLKVVTSGGGVTFKCYVNLYDGNGDQLVYNLTDTLGSPFTSGEVGFRGVQDGPNNLHIQNFHVYACSSAYTGSAPPASGDYFIYPSPARGDNATVAYNMAQTGQMDLKVWNEKAELVTHVTDSKGAGVQTTPFSIAGFGTGVYFYSLTLSYSSGRVEKLGPKKFAILH